MLELVEVKAFQDISIRDLVKAAERTHPTFYRNYSAKEEILAEIATEQMRQLMTRMQGLVERRDPRATSLSICDYVQEHRKLWTTLLTTGATAILREEFINASKKLVADRPPLNPDLPTDMAAAVVASGIIEILTWWLQQPDDYPSDNIAQFLEWLVLDRTLGPDGFSLKKY